ncbi:hypothetical protein [Streptomyces calidiresistens]|uniref:hypothetical protein n=1 Tax=Streptomyces calidiresistens TaxID=1485586 RepID=UPI001E3B647A|nr:hypothetical protein [Streptomyces calidiresistens]
MAHTPVAPRPAADGVAPPGPPARLDDPPSALVPRGEGSPDDLALSPPPKSSGDKDAVNALAALNRLFGNDPAWHRFLMQRMGIDQGVQVFMVRNVSSAPASGTPAIQPFDFTIPGGTGGRVTFDGSVSTATPGTGGHPLRVEVGTGDSPVVRITEELGPNATRQWTIGADGNPVDTGIQRVTLTDGTGTPVQITLRLDGAGAPEGVTHAGGGTVTTGNVSLLPGGAELRITDPTTGNFTLHTTTGDLRYSATSLQLHGPAHPLANHYLTTTPDGTLGLLRGDGAPVPSLTSQRATITPQTGMEPGTTRIGTGDHHLVVDGDGRHIHNAITLRGADGAPTGTHLFTPSNVTGTPTNAIARNDLGTPVPNTAVTRHDGHWHVTDTTTGNFTRYTDDGTVRYDALALRNPDGGPTHPLGDHYLTTAPNGDLGLIQANANRTVFEAQIGATIIRHTDLAQGGFRIDTGLRHVVVDANGRHTHNAITLENRVAAGTASHLFVPPDTARATPPPATAHIGPGTEMPNLNVTRVDGKWHITDTTTGDFTRYNGDGSLRYHALSLRHPDGGPALAPAGHYITTAPNGDLGLMKAVPQRLTPGGTAYHPIPGATVTLQTGAPDLRAPGAAPDTGHALRVHHGDHHLVVGPNGVPTHTVVTPRGADGQPIPDTFLFTPVPAPGGAPGAVTVRTADGSPSPGVTLRPHGEQHLLSNNGNRTFTLNGSDGSFVHGGLKLDRAPLNAAGSGLVRTFEGNGPLVLLDDNLARIADLRVTRTPGGNIRVGNGNHEFDLFTPQGQLTHTVRATPAPAPAGGSAAGAATPAPAGSTLTVTDVRAGTSFTVIRASDGADSLFLDTNALRALDGDLNVLGPLTREGTDLRLNDPRGGVHAGEFRRYDAGGDLRFERINIVHGNAARPNEHFEITIPSAAGEKPTWVRVTPGHPAGPGARGWFDGGTVDTKGLANGRVRLLDAGKVEVFERRVLPGGDVLDFHRASTSTEFGLLDQRGVWSRIDGNGAVVGHGTRHFGESTRSWFDVQTHNGFDLRVRHFRENPDGGHVLADMHTHAFLQGGHKATWVRFDADFKPIASGTREFTHGRGWRDHAFDPATGNKVLVHEKFGRFNPLTAADNRSYFQRVITDDGTIKPDWTTISAHGKENAFGKTLKSGEFLEGRRLMEQRPPAWLRNTMLPINGNSLANTAPWLGGGGVWNTLTRADGLHQAFSLTLRAAPDGAVTARGARFIASDASTLDISAAGAVTGHTRKLFHGTTLTVGDVTLPTGATRRDGYLPWKDGDNGLQGHRSFADADINAVTLPNGVTGDVRWVDRYPGAAGVDDWYTPTPHRPTGGADPDWRTARIGLTDGRTIDFRAAPEVRATPLTDSAAHRRDIAPGPGRNPDHTVYDPQGVPVARADTFPNPNGGAGTISVRGTGGFDSPSLIGSRMTFSWSADVNGTNLTGVRKVNFDRSMDRWTWDRESFQDFGRVGPNDHHLLREHRLLADGVTLDAWRVTKADGSVEWQWRKIDRHGNDLRFDTGAPGTQIRTWHDANGNRLLDWQPGARWVDTVRTNANTPWIVQEMPYQPRITAADSFGDAPLRVREYVATPDKLGGAPPTHPSRGAWREFDNGIVVRTREKAPDGTFLVSEEWQKHALRFDSTDPTVVIGGRDIAGYVRSTDGGPGPLVLAGRDGNFLGNLNEFRGWDRMLREVNRWEWRGTSEGVPGYRSFGLKSAQSIGIDFLQDWLLDFTMNLTVYGIIAGVNGHEFTGTDVLKAMFGATVSSGTKSLITGGHHLHKRGGPGKVGLSSADQGQPFHRRPNDDNWAAEFAGNEKVTRWRAGSYDFGVNFATSSLAGFINGAAMSAIFGVRDANGNIVRLSGLDALREGAIGMASGALGGLSVGLGKTILQQTLGGRLWHRQGFFDIFVVGGLGKIAEKSFGGLFLTGALRDLNPPDWRTPSAPDAGGVG